VRESNAYPDSNAFIHAYTYGGSDGHPYSHCHSNGYGYAYGDAGLHTELHIHIGHRNARAGNHRHWKPLR
jgi:hypothetical protein